MKVITVFAGLIGSAAAFAPSPMVRRSLPSNVAATTNSAAPRVASSTSLRMASEEAFVPDMERRVLMNWILVGSAAVTIGGLAVPFVLFFVPPGTGGGSGGTTAKDALGNDIMAAAYLAEKPAGDRSLAQGLKGDATYLIVKDDKTLESYGLNAVCTHLGCVVPWSAANNKFICPCHGSQYAPDGRVVRGPAPLPLALAHTETTSDGKILFSPWTETDFRTEEKPWWV